jgi:hypothetical protein
MFFSFIPRDHRFAGWRIAIKFRAFPDSERSSQKVQWRLFYPFFVSTVYNWGHAIQQR